MNNREKELREAIEAGELALRSLKMAQEKLSSAKGWGFFDMLGGGMLAGIMKHSRLNDASKYMETAKEHLFLFQTELSDIDVPLNIRMEIGSFLTFADFFFDGIVADYLVQNKIADAAEQVEDAIDKVESILRNLHSIEQRF